jgi:ComF family protein
MRAALRYEEPTSQIIHRFKYEGYFALGEPLAGLMVAGWPAWEQPPDLLLPIPLHPRRRRRRGYNQSELLARPLGRDLSIQVDTTILARVRHTLPQVGLGPDERRHNVSGAFAASPAVQGRHVLLIDDVLTTGATLSAAAEAALRSGAASVSAYCLARVS